MSDDGKMTRGTYLANPSDIVNGFLDRATKHKISVFLVYGYASEGRATIKSASNVPPDTTEGLRRTMLGVDEIGMLTAAQALHKDIGGCDVCPPRNETKPWDQLTDAEVQHHIRVVRIVFDSLKARSTAKPV